VEGAISACTLPDVDDCATAPDVHDEQHLPHLLRQLMMSSSHVGSPSVALEEYDEVGGQSLRANVGVHMSRWMDMLMYGSRIGELLTENYGMVA
jgi:hypothetical protein